MPREFEIRFGRMSDNTTPLQQFISGKWVDVPIAAGELSPVDTMSKAAALPPLPAKPEDAGDLDTLIAVLIGGRPRECHVTHIDQCTATVDLRDLMRVAGPEWRAKLAEIDATHATNQAARLSRELEGAVLVGLKVS